MVVTPSNPSRGLTLLVLAVAVVAFLPSLGGGFLADDFAYIDRFRALAWSDWPRLFTRDWSGGIWGDPLRELRPLVALSFMGDAKLFGGNPLGYRCTNLALHLLSVILVMRLAKRYAVGTSGPLVATARRAEVAGLVAGLVFALHPAHAEAVGWITGRVDVQATAAALLFWSAAEAFVASGGIPRALLAWFAFFLGVFSKELCLFAPLLLMLRWFLLDLRAPREVWRRRIGVLMGVVVLLIMYGACRRAAFGHDSIGYNLWTDAPAWERQAHYFGWLLPVLPFTARGEWQNLPSTTILHAVWIAIAGAILVGFAAALWRRAQTLAAVIFFGGVWYLVTVFPMTGVVYFSPRHLYFPSVGVALAAGLACALVRWRIALGVALTVWCIAGHAMAIRPWIRAANVSAGAIAALDRELVAGAADTVVVTSVPETLGPTLLWAWSSPPCLSAPFLAHPPRAAIERPANYIRSAQWYADRQPVETLNAAKSIVALYVDPNGSIATRRVTDNAAAQHAAAFAQLVATGALNPDSLSAWVKSIAQP